MKIGNLSIFKKSHDGGKDSGVTGYWLIEYKKLFSVVLLRFSEGSRDAYHSHAFNAYTWWLKGSVVEEYVTGDRFNWKPSIWPKYTPKNCYHKIIADRASWALSFRGPWDDTWKETKDGKEVTLTHGRLPAEIPSGGVAEIEDIVQSYLKSPEDYSVIFVNLGRQKGHTSWVKHKLATDDKAFLFYSNYEAKRTAMIPNKNTVMISGSGFSERFRGTRPTMFIIDVGLLQSDHRRSDKWFGIIQELRENSVNTPIVVVGE